MAKEKGKKFKRKGKNVGKPNAKMKKAKISEVSPPKTIVPASPAPLAGPAGPTASDPASNYNGGASQCKEKEREKGKRLAGFIFMCNPSTKLECYQYRVFGLPSSKKEVVEEIQPGAKLFLFDFESKLLYGIYEATSAGKLNLEPAAFKGKFPAQVKFKIFKECLPLPESFLRHVIKENYTGSKFKQELSGKQVRKLLSSFRPLNASSSSQPEPQALSNVSLSWAMPPLAMKNRFRHTGRLPTMEVPHLAGSQYGRVPPSDQQLGYHISAFVERRYRTVEEKAPHDQVIGLGRRYMTVPYDPATSSERQYHHRLPLQRAALYQDNNVAAYNPNLAASAQYTSSVTQLQPQFPAPYHHQRPLQGGKDILVAYNSNTAAGAQYTTAPVSQPQGPATYHQHIFQREAVHRDNVVAYNSYSTASARYASSVTRPLEVAPGVSQLTVPITSYYSYTAANPPIR